MIEAVAARLTKVVSGSEVTTFAVASPASSTSQSYVTGTGPSNE